MQTRIGRNVRKQLVLQFCGLQICDSKPGHRTTLLNPLSARPPTKEGVLQKRSTAIIEFERLRHMLLHACSVALHSGLVLVSGSETALLLAAGESCVRLSEGKKGRRRETSAGSFYARMCSRRLIAYEHADCKNVVFCNSWDQTHNARMCPWRQGGCSHRLCKNALCKFFN